jgi:hypothetical protein
MLPDQSRAHIPAEWTDLEGANSATQISSSRLGSMNDLLRTRSVVDALVNRSPLQTQAADSNLEKERRRATKSRIPKSSCSGKSDMGGTR